MKMENQPIDKLTRKLIDYGTPQCSDKLKLNIMQCIMQEAKVTKHKRISSKGFSLNWFIGVAVYVLICIMGLLLFQAEPGVVKQAFGQVKDYAPFGIAAFMAVLSFFFFVQLDRMFTFCR